LQLLPANRRLDVRHAVVVAQHGVRLEDHRTSTVSYRVRDTHPVLPKQSEPGVPVSIGSGDHAAITGAHDLSGVKRETRNVRVGSADTLPAILPANLAADRAGCVLHDL